MKLLLSPPEDGNLKILPASHSGSKMVFPGDYSLFIPFILQDVDISNQTKDIEQ